MKKGYKIILWILVIYFVIGVLFYLSFDLNTSLKTFSCKDPSSPNGEVIIFNNSYSSPRKNCSRNVFLGREIGSASAIIPLWPVLLFGKE